MQIRRRLGLGGANRYAEQNAPAPNHAARFGRGGARWRLHQPAVGPRHYDDRVGPICEQDNGSEQPAPLAGRADIAGAWRLQARVPARHLAREAVRPVAAAATQPPGRCVPQAIQLKIRRAN